MRFYAKQQENSALKSISLTCSQLVHYEWRGGKARLGEQEVHITFLILLFFFYHRTGKKPCREKYKIYRDPF